MCMSQSLPIPMSAASITRRVWHHNVAVWPSTVFRRSIQVLGDTEGPEVDGLRAVEARKVRHEGDDPHAREGVRVILVQGSNAHGGARSEARSGGRLVAFKSQEACMSAPSAPSDASSEVQRLQDLVSQLQAKIDAQGQDPDVPCVPAVKRFCWSGLGHVQVPMMPNSIPAELSIWLEERHAECTMLS